MKMEELQQLANIYNSLLDISVKGTDAYLLVDAERALYNFIKMKEQDIKNKQIAPVEENKNQEEEFMALKKLYPPEIEGIIPAFCGTVLTVPFSMNKTVSKSEVSGMILKIKTVYSNQYLGAAKTYFNGSAQEIWDRVDFDLSGIIDKLNISQ